LRLADKAVKLAPRAGWLRAWRALGLLKAGRREEALKEFNACLRLQPCYHRALAWRGALLRELGRPAEALADLDCACAIDELYPIAAN
jgi:tetratricopeptide (TPR) repeat protein